MANKLELQQHLNVALIGGDRFARGGITALLQGMYADIQITTSINDYQHLDDLLAMTPIDVIFISGLEKHHTGMDCLAYIKTIKASYPRVLIYMYSAAVNSSLWVHGDIDAYVSLQDPLYRWRNCLLKIAENRAQPKKKSMALSLTPGEWRVLKKLRNGLDIRYIAEIEKLSYRRVSALKSSAIRKLGLRNKTDLLVFLTS